MTESSIKCAKCNSTMQRGHVPDREAGGYGPQKWFPGELEVGALGGVSKSEHAPIYVITFRCEGCGFLDSYAPGDIGGG